MPTQTDIKLDTITLSGLVWADEHSYSPVRSDVAKTLNGGVVVWETPEDSGRPIDLTGGPNHGWMTRDKAEDIQALAAVPGAVYTLTTPSGGTYQVRFRNEDPPAFSAQPLIERPNPASGDYYHSVTIKLMEV